MLISGDRGGVTGIEIAAHGSFPTLSLRIFPWMLDAVPRRAHCVHLPVSSAMSSAFSQGRRDRLAALLRKDDSRGPFFEVADISYSNLVNPQMSRRCAYCRRAAGALRPGLSCFVTSARMDI